MLAEAAGERGQVRVVQLLGGCAWLQLGTAGACGCVVAAAVAAGCWMQAGPAGRRRPPPPRWRAACLDSMDRSKRVLAGL